jgi:hypothetical protein
VAALIAEFQGQELDQPVRLSVYDSHIEISLDSGESAVTIKVAAEELGRIEVVAVLGVPMLVIEDTSGIQVAALAMEGPDAARAEGLLAGIREAGE